MIDRSLIRLDGMRSSSSTPGPHPHRIGQKQRTFTTVDVSALAKSTVELFTAEAAARGITMQVEPGEAVEMVADAANSRSSSTTSSPTR